MPKPLEQISSLELKATLLNVELDITAHQTRGTLLTTTRAAATKRDEQDQMDSQMRNVNSEVSVLQTQAAQIRSILAQRGLSLL